MIKNLKSYFIAIVGSVILSFGLYNVHSFSCITEGGVLGMSLFIKHWFGISPSVSSMIMNILCYCVGYKLLGKQFIVFSIVYAIGFSVSFRIFEIFPPVFPAIADYPLLASVVGALFIGVGAGLCVRVNAAPGGDDALAMGISKLTGMKIEYAYLLIDLVVIGLSLTYISFSKMWYSLLTVIISGQIVGVVQKIGFKKGEE